MVSTARMAPPLSYLLPEGSSQTGVVYLVRSFEFILESVSRDWHVQPSCQRSNRGPPERRAFSPGEFFFVGNPTRANPTVLETLQTYCAALNPVNARLPQDFQMISTSGVFQIGPGQESKSSKSARNSMQLPFETTPLSAFAFWAARYGRQEIEKRTLTLEVLALKVPFGMLLKPNRLFRIKSRGRDD